MKILRLSHAKHPVRAFIALQITFTIEVDELLNVLKKEREDLDFDPVSVIKTEREDKDNDDD